MTRLAIWLASTTIISTMLLPGAGFAAPDLEESIADEALLSAPAKRYLLDGPEILKVGPRTKNLVVDDLNGDGVADIAVITNEKSLLEIYYGEKESEQDDASPFRHETITLDRIVRTMVCIDVDGDGRQDLLLSSSPARLAVMYQDDDGKLGAPQNLSLKADRLIKADVTGNGRDDVVVYTEQRFDLLLAERRGLSLEPAHTFYATGELASDPMVIDLDGDGRMDIVYHDARKFENIVARLQSAEKTFPWETRLETSVLRAAKAFPRAGSEKDSIAAIHNTTRHLVMLDYTDSEQEGDPLTFVPQSRFRTIPFDPRLRSGKTYPVVADVNGDGRLDIVISSPELSSVQVYTQTRSGAFTVESMPTLQGVEKVLPVQAPKGEPQPLLFLSKEDKAVGFARYDTESETIPYPTILPIEGEPLGISVVDIGGQRHLAVILAPKEGSEIPMLYGYELSNDGKLGEAKYLYSDTDLDDAFPLHEADVVGLETLDINNDRREDLVVFADFKPAVIFLQTQDGKMDELEASSSVLKGILSGARASNLLSIQMEGSKGTATALALRDKFARALTVGENGDVVVTRQLNGRDATSRLAAATVGNLRKGDLPEVVLLDRGNRILTIYGAADPDDSNSDYEILTDVELGDTAYNAVITRDMDGDGLDDLLMTADDRLVVVYTSPWSPTLEGTMNAPPYDEEDGGYGQLFVEQFLAEGDPEIAAIEMQDNLLDLFETGENEAEESALLRFYSFLMYDMDRSIARRANLDALPEPRELLAADLDDDGRSEIITLMHDNIIIYRPVEKETEPKE